jgi:hypothetical protein
VYSKGMVIGFLISFLSVGCSSYNFERIDDGSLNTLDVPADAPGSLDNFDSMDDYIDEGQGGSAVDIFESDNDVDLGDGGDGYVPPVQRIKATYCDVLVDQSGFYFNFLTGGQGSENYVALTGVTECAYNEINDIEGECDDETEFTVLTRDTIGSGNLTEAHLLNDQRGQQLTFEPSNGEMYFCLAAGSGAVVSFGGSRLILME